MKRKNIFLRSVIVAATALGIAGTINNPATAASDGYYAAGNIVLAGGFSHKKHHFKKFGHSSKGFRYKKVHRSSNFGHNGFSNRKFHKKKFHKKKFHNRGHVFYK